MTGSLVLATEHLKRHRSDLFYMDTSLIGTLRSVPPVYVLKRFNCKGIEGRKGEKGRYLRWLNTVLAVC